MRQLQKIRLYLNNYRNNFMKFFNNLMMNTMKKLDNNKLNDYIINIKCM